MRLGPLLIVFLIVVAVYTLPYIVATISGTHTMEVNMSASVKGLQCVNCHEYIWDELSLTDESSNVLQAHRNAAGNTNYTAGWLTLNITNTTDSGVCLLCHLAQIQIQGSHTQVVTRACTDLDCHGTNESTNNTAYNVGDIGLDLGNQTNVHERWFDAMSGYKSAYQNETGANYTKGYWACLGCHTHVKVSINATEAAYPHDDPSAEQKRYL